MVATRRWQITPPFDLARVATCPARRRRPPITVRLSCLPVRTTLAVQVLGVGKAMSKEREESGATARSTCSL